MITPTTLFIALYPLGNSMPDDATACQVAAEVPARERLLVDQDTPSSAERTWFPPGLVCTVDVYRNGKPEVTVHQNWAASILALLEVGAATGICVRLLMALGHVLRSRRSAL